MTHETEAATSGGAIDRQTAPWFVLVKSSATFVKDGDFFREQGGLHDSWGDHWEPVQAATITEARDHAIRLRRERFPDCHRTFRQDGVTLETINAEGKATC